MSCASRCFLPVGLLLLLIAGGCTNQAQIGRLASDAAQAEARGETEVAISRWTALLRLDAKDRDAHFRRAALYEQRGDTEKAIADYTEYVRLPLRKPGLRERLGIGSDEMQPVQDFSYSALCQRALLHAKQRNITAALKDLEEANRINPDDPTTFVFRAQVFDVQGDSEKSFDSLTQAIKKAPKNAIGYTYRGAFLSRRGKEEEAIADLDEALRLDPQSADALMHRGLAYAKFGQYDKGLEDLGAAIEISHKAPELFAARGAIFFEKGAFDEAFKDFNHALLLHPNEPMSLASRGYALFRQGNVELALADLKQAIALNPGNYEACNNLAWLRATCTDASFRNGKEAVELATKACELTGFKTPTALDTLAAAYAEAGDFGQAIKYQTQCLELLPADSNKRPEMRERLSLYEQRQPFRLKVPLNR